MSHKVSHWVFGYGSLIFRVDFPYLEKKPAWVLDWQRRFWQGSHDHRGVPEAPGRVLTLVTALGARCDGMAYKVDAQVFAHLDHREKNGYARIETPLYFHDGSQELGLFYLAAEDNEAYLGPAPMEQIAAQIAASVGPSGSNRDYLLDLAGALRALGVEDEHVFALERLVLAQG